ncbi:unnamed protein product [Gadus morhua 'NCC']
MVIAIQRSNKSRLPGREQPPPPPRDPRITEEETGSDQRKRQSLGDPRVRSRARVLARGTSFSSGDPVGILAWVSSARPDIRGDAEMLSITRNYLPRVDEARL